MIETLKINNFKSIKAAEIACRRINLFIGEPNTGKSNLLEALGLLSWCGNPTPPIKQFVRFQLAQHLFYDGLTDEPIRIEIRGVPSIILYLVFENDTFHFRQDPKGTDIGVMNYRGGASAPRLTGAARGESGHSLELPGASAPRLTGPARKLKLRRRRLGASVPPLPDAARIRFYRYQQLEKFESGEPSSLIPPNGPNLFSAVYGSKTLREQMVELFRPFGLTVVMKPHEKAFELQKQVDGVATSVPYSLASDTLQRIVFYSVAMASNKDSTLVFEEPEAHAFPYYTKHLGEMIALDQSNQYFITTHNPYLFGAIAEKAKKDDLAVSAIYFENYETKVKPLSDNELATLMDADPFLSLEAVIKGEV